MVWGEFGHQGVFPGKRCWGITEQGSVPGARVQQLDLQLGRKMLSREEPRSLSDRNTTASFKKHISGDVSWQDGLASSKHHHHSTGCPKCDSLWGKTAYVTTLNWKGQYFRMFSPYAICLLFSCHHLSVALLSTSTNRSRIFSQTSAGKMLLTHSGSVTDSILKKHTLFLRWVILWTDHEISCKSPVTLP